MYRIQFKEHLTVKHLIALPTFLFHTRQLVHFGLTSEIYYQVNIPVSKHVETEHVSLLPLPLVGLLRVWTLLRDSLRPFLLKKAFE